MKKLLVFLLFIAIAVYQVFFPNPRLVTRENYERIKIGMTEAEVKKILGRPSGSNAHNDASRQKSPEASYIDKALNFEFGGNDIFKDNPLIDHIVGLMNVSAWVETHKETSRVRRGMEEFNYVSNGISYEHYREESITHTIVKTIIKFVWSDRADAPDHIQTKVEHALASELQSINVLREKDKSQSAVRLIDLPAQEANERRVRYSNVSTVYGRKENQERCTGSVGAICAIGSPPSPSPRSSRDRCPVDVLFGAVEMDSDVSEIQTASGSFIINQNGGFSFDMPSVADSGLVNPKIKGRFLGWKGKNGKAIYAVVNSNVTYCAYICPSSMEVKSAAKTNPVVSPK